MTPAPNPPPRGAEPRVNRVSDKRAEDMLQSWLSECHDHDVTRVLLDRRDDRAEIADLRDKLEAAEARAHKAKQDQARFSVNANARLSEAEAAVREMIEQRDGARKAGALAMRDAAVSKIKALTRSLMSIPLTGVMAECRKIRCEALEDATESLAALAPPAKTTAKEERT